MWGWGIICELPHRTSNFVCFSGDLEDIFIRGGGAPSFFFYLCEFNKFLPDPHEVPRIMHPNPQTLHVCVENL